MEKQNGNGKSITLDEDGFIETQKKSKPLCNVRSCWICNENYHPRNNNYNNKPRQRKPMNTNFPKKYCSNNCKFCTKLIERLRMREDGFNNNNFQEDNYFTVFFQ